MTEMMKNALSYIGTLGMILLPFLAACQCTPDVTIMAGNYDTLSNMSSSYTNCLPSCSGGGNSAMIGLPSGGIHLLVYCPDTTNAQITVIDSCKLVLIDTCVYLDGDAPMGLGEFWLSRFVGTGKVAFIQWGIGDNLIVNSDYSFAADPTVIMNLDTVCTPSVGLDLPELQEADYPIIDIITGQIVTSLQNGRVYLKGKKKFVVH